MQSACRLAHSWCRRRPNASAESISTLSITGLTFSSLAFRPTPNGGFRVTTAATPVPNARPSSAHRCLRLHRATFLASLPTTTYLSSSAYPTSQGLASHGGATLEALPNGVTIVVGPHGILPSVFCMQPMGAVAFESPLSRMSTGHTCAVRAGFSERAATGPIAAAKL